LGSPYTRSNTIEKVTGFKDFDACSITVIKVYTAVFWEPVYANSCIL